MFVLVFPSSNNCRGHKKPLQVSPCGLGNQTWNTEKMGQRQRPFVVQIQSNTMCFCQSHCLVIVQESFATKAYSRLFDFCTLQPQLLAMLIYTFWVLQLWAVASFASLISDRILGNPNKITLKKWSKVSALLLLVSAAPNPRPSNSAHCAPAMRLRSRRNSSSPNPPGKSRGWHWKCWMFSKISGFYMVLPESWTTVGIEDGGLLRMLMENCELFGTIVWKLMVGCGWNSRAKTLLGDVQPSFPANQVDGRVRCLV